jgi:hypothetical protein
MKVDKRLLYIPLIALFIEFTIFLVIAVSTSSVLRDMQAGKVPKYELGEQQGAKVCASCHQEIYDDWSKNSVHAIATTNEDFLSFKHKFTGNFMLNAMMGEEMCYACHGSKEVNEGVNCETCHGTANPDVAIMETHEKKFKPKRMKEMSRSTFCPKCHTMRNPMTGDYIMSLYNEWLESEAHEKRYTCQGCHMEPKGGSELLYHGFDSVSRNVEIYEGDVSIKNIILDFPQFSLDIENHVIGHAIPATGPSRILVLEVSLQDLKGREVHNIIQTFGKKYELMPIIGLMPFKQVENTQLQSGETRQLRFTLPSSLEGQINNAIISIRFYDVSDEHQGDITKAHWISEPILKKEVNL